MSLFKLINIGFNFILVTYSIHSISILNFLIVISISTIISTLCISSFFEFFQLFHFIIIILS